VNSISPEKTTGHEEFPEALLPAEITQPGQKLLTNASGAKQFFAYWAYLPGILAGVKTKRPLNKNKTGRSHQVLAVERIA
jgi:hypothetical protein